MAQTVVTQVGECPVCREACGERLGRHLRASHGEAALREAVLAAKKTGTPDAEIGAAFGISFAALQKIITQATGASVSAIRAARRPSAWEPREFREETTTLWSFRQRGKWATHDGRYRGNWSPFIPRNLVLKYSRPGELVLDYFSGGGTTAVEAKLLGRRCIARDINPAAVEMTRENLAFSLPSELFPHRDLPLYEPEVSIGDARRLDGVADESVDLICAHPPYAGIIKYTAGLAGDLSGLGLPEFLAAMAQVASESMRVLKPGGACAILVGDARKARHVVPIGFETIRVFLAAGFELDEFVIKRQHNCKTTGFWYAGSVKHNFLLLAHEYLPVFRKPHRGGRARAESAAARPLPVEPVVKALPPADDRKLEATTVWLLPGDDLHGEVVRNLTARYARRQPAYLSFPLRKVPEPPVGALKAPSLAYIEAPPTLEGRAAISGYCRTLSAVARKAARILGDGGTLAVEARDLRIGRQLWPLGFLAWETLSREPGIVLREIVVLAPQDASPAGPLSAAGGPLRIAHSHLLIYGTSA